MTLRTSIRKWGNSAGTILPAPALARAGFQLGDALDIEASDGQIVIKQASSSYTLQQLLDATPPESVVLEDEDSQWLNSSVGKENIDG